MSDDLSPEPAPEPAPEAASGDEHPSRWGKRSRVLAGVGVVALAAGAGFGVNALTADDDTSTVEASAPDSGSDSSGNPQRAAFQRPTSGTIAEISDSTLSLVTDDDETIEVEAVEDATITDVSEGELDDLSVGDFVQVMGEATDDDSESAVAARSISTSSDEELLTAGGGPGGGMGTPPEMPSGDDQGTQSEGQTPPDMPDGAQGPGGGRTVGTIESIDGDTITLATEDGDTVTVTTTDDTTVRVIEALTWDDLAVDDEVSVSGSTADGVFSATSIRRGAVDSGFGPGDGSPPQGTPPTDADTDAGTNSSDG